jgi:ankyrin repeat protein
VEELMKADLLATYAAVMMTVAMLGSPQAALPATAGPTAAGPLKIAATIDAPKVGDNVLRMIVTDAGGTRVPGANITTDVNMTSMDMGEAQPPVTDLGGGRYQATVTFTMRGQWRVILTASAPGAQKPQVQSFDFLLTAHSPTRHHRSPWLTGRQQAAADAALLGLWKATGTNGAPAVTVAQVKAALRRGADVNAQNDYDVTPLILAARTGDLACVKYLIAREADLNARDVDRWSALHWASEADKPDCVEYLVARGADVNARNIVGGSALLYSLQAGDIACADFLIAHGAAVNVKDNDGATPLMQAAYAGSLSCVKLLLAKGADPNARDNDGHTALNSAGGHTDIVAVLRKAMATR